MSLGSEAATDPPTDPSIRGTSVPLQVGEDWRGVEDVFGGKVISLLADCVTAAGPGRMGIASLWVEFSGSVVPGEVDGAVEVLHAGRSTATLRASVSQQGRSRASAMAKLVAAGGRPALGVREMAGVPTPDSLDDLVPPWGALPYDPRVQVKVVTTGPEVGVLTTQAWVRVRPHGGDDLGPAGVAAVLLDLMPPGLFFTDRAPRFVPTVDFALHLDPSTPAVAGEWYWGEVRTEWADDQFCAESAVLRRADGAFVARAAQTRRIVW